jgi:protein-S-isoprenylcysteine O-methyltransferase Ste14
MIAMDRANVRILPPIVLAVVLSLQVLFATLLPGRIFPGAVAILLGLPVLLASIVLVAFAVREIRRARTSFDVRKPTTAIATTGVFRFTRNPVYLSMTLLVLGLGFVLNSPWSLLLTIPTGALFLLPCNVIVQEAGAGKVEVAAIDPRTAMERVGNPALMDLANEVADKLTRVISAI